MEAKIEVLQPGLFSTIQDRGRFGFSKYGVPQSGAMDRQAAGMANLLLKNDQQDAVLEITLQGPTLYFPESQRGFGVGFDVVVIQRLFGRPQTAYGQ